ncbi:MAG: NUDIX domain-containing protein [Chloroflexi bacterium]|nr:NUDIX domain-containing protein [Chloroflexota bacterium]
MTMNKTDRTPARQIALWADMLRDIAANGGRFASNVYDRENYERITTIAMEMMGMATAVSLSAIEPLRHTLFAQPSPIPVVDAAIINEQNEILLIRRADNGLWAMPGGGTMVGESPAEAAVREGWEETGIRSESIGLVGIFDSLNHNGQSPNQLYQIVFLCRPLNLDNPDLPHHPQETLEKAWFSEDTLPSDLDPNHILRIPKVFDYLKSQEGYFE